MNELRERGIQVFAEIMGEERGVEMRSQTKKDGFAGAMAGLAADFAFGSVWARDGLERKYRSLVTIGVLIAQRQSSELRNHIRIGLTNGLSKREIEEALLQSAPYVGFPALATATTAMIEVFRERGLDTEARTPEERGVL